MRFATTAVVQRSHLNSQTSGQNGSTDTAACRTVFNVAKRGEIAPAISNSGLYAFALNLGQKADQTVKACLRSSVGVHIIDTFNARKLMVQAHFDDSSLHVCSSWGPLP